MSLRDDLDYIAEHKGMIDSYRNYDEENRAIERLRAALTPAAEKWLEALPELLELKAKASPTPWEWWDAVGLRVDDPGGNPVCWWPIDYAKTQDEEDLQINNADLIEALGNALHEAAALHDATDEKEQK